MIFSRNKIENQLHGHKASIVIPLILPLNRGFIFDHRSLTFGTRSYFISESHWDQDNILSKSLLGED